MDRKTVYAMILIGVIFIGWLYLTSPNQQPTTTPSQTQTDTISRETSQETTEEPVKTEQTRLTETDSLDIPTEMSDSVYARFDTIQAQTVNIETDLYKAEFNGKGANITSFKFLDYFYNNGDTTEVEMVPPWAKFALKFDFPDADDDNFDFQRIVFTPSKTNLNISGTSSDKLVFSANLTDDDYIEVTYTFYGNRYDFDVRLDIEGPISRKLGETYFFGWKEGLESTEKNRKDDFNSFRANAMWDSGLEKYKDFDHGRLYLAVKGAPKWVATRSKYFFVCIDPERSPEGMVVDGEKIDINEKVGQPGMTKIGVQVEMKIHERKSLFDKYTVYVGPIEYDILKGYNRGYEHTADMGGILKPISIFILWLMKSLYSVFHNYGLVIIVFSILMKVVFYPLTSRSLKSMKKMQELQPKLKAIQEKYKSEPQKLNAEVMKLWKENKVNPMGGCLLMLPQLPIFFALFSVFRNTIVLRGSEFMFWLQDLSQPDQTLILPIIMAGTMFLQQKMTMQDPKQKMLVYILPVVFFFLFKGFSSGLVLYWTMFNVLSVLETIFIRKPQSPVTAPVQKS